MTDKSLEATSSSNSSQNAALLAILLSLCSGGAFTAGGLFVCCSTRFADSRKTSSLSPLALVLAFSTSAFVFISGGVAGLLPLVQSGFEQLVLKEHNGDGDEILPDAARGMSHLLATTSFAAGILLLYGVNMTVHKLTAAASACYGDPPAQLENRELSGDSLHCIDLSIVNIRASSATTDDDFGLNSSAAVDFDVLQSTDRPRDVQLSKDPKAEPFQGQSTTLQSTAHVRASVISVIAIVLHHMPDGKAFASSVYFASGNHARGLLWSLLCPLGRILGSLVAWSLLVQDDKDALSSCFLAGMAAGALVAIGVVQILPTACACAGGRSYGLVLGVVVGSALLALPKVIVE